MRLKNFVFSLVFSSLALLGNSADNTVTLAGFEMTPYSSEGLNENGLAVRIIREALGRSGWALNIKLYPTRRASKLAESGETDGFIMATTNFTTPAFVYSEPFISSTLVVIHNNQLPITFDSFKSLEGKQIGSISGWGLENAFPNLDWMIVDKIDQLLSMLLYGRIQAFMYEEFALQYSIAKLKKEEQENLEIIGPPIADVDYGIAINTNNLQKEKILQAFNTGLASMKEDGALAKIIAEYRN